MNIYLDFDDTITDSLQNLTRIVNKRYNKRVKWNDVGKWDFSDVYPDIPLRDIVKVFGEQEFFDTVYAKEYAILALHKLTKRNNAYIVSKCDNEASKRKNEWIKNNLEGIGVNVQFMPVPLNGSKSMVDMSDGIFVDDNVKFLEETNAKYKIFFNNHRKFDTEQKWDGLEADNWYDLYDIMADIIGKEKGITNGKI